MTKPTHGVPSVLARFPHIPRRINDKLNARECAAYHEAAHAVVGDYWALTVVEVTIVSAAVDKHIGRTKFEEIGPGDHAAKMDGIGYCEPYERCNARDSFEAEVMKGIAGAIAEKMACGKLDHDGAEADYEAAITRLRHSLGAETDDELLPYFELLAVRTRDILDRKWLTVKRVAEALIDRGTLGAADFVAICAAGPQPSTDYRRLNAEVKRPVDWP